MKFFLKALLFLLPFSFASCSQVAWPALCGCCGTKYISVLNEPIDQERRASVHVNAPDPLHEINPHGQRLYISWKLPAKYKETTISGLLKIRYHVAEQVTIPFEMKKLHGTMIYQLLNKEYFEKEGILAYKVQIFSDGHEIDSYQNTMWTELISCD